MEYQQLFDFKDVEFLGLNEPKSNSLRLFFNICRVSSTLEKFEIGDIVIKDTYPVIIDKEQPIIQIDFEGYVSYTITNESLTYWDEYLEFEGKAFRKYSKSRYFDFIKIHTSATDEYPGPLKHFGMICGFHVIDIMTISNPIITGIERNKGVIKN